LKTHAWIVLLALVISARGQQQQTDSRASESFTVIRAGSLIDGKSDKPRHNQVIVIHGNRIESVTDAANAKIPAGATVIDLSAATLLARSHRFAHPHLLAGRGSRAGRIRCQHYLNAPLALRAARATVAARRALEQRLHHAARPSKPEGAGYGDVGIKQAIDQGYIPGPRLFVSTRRHRPPRAVIRWRATAPELDMPKGAQIVDGPVEARKAAREQLDHGADWIKVYMTHRSWVGKNGELVSQPTLTVESCNAHRGRDSRLGQESRLPRPTAESALHRALDGGCDSIEHGLDLDDAAIAQMLKQGTWYVPTISAYYHDWAPADTPAGQRGPPAGFLARAVIKKALKANVKIVFGTGHGRNSLDRAHRAGILPHGRARHASHGCHSVPQLPAPPPCSTWTEKSECLLPALLPT